MIIRITGNIGAKGYFKSFITFLSFILLHACNQGDNSGPLLTDIISSENFIPGKSEYLASPCVTAGDRVYMIGFQDGSFPDLGWHIRGEMGGIWDHPVKLMDGFTASINGKCLSSANKFINYPMANAQFYQSDSLVVERFQFIPDSLEAVVVEYKITNLRNKKRKIKFNFTGMTDLLPVWLSDSLNIKNGPDISSFNDPIGGFITGDSLNDWYVIFGSDLKPAAHAVNPVTCTAERMGSGMNASLTYYLTLDPGSSASIDFYITGSYSGKDHAVKQFNYVKANAKDLLLTKIRKYKAIKRTAEITLPDSGIQKMFTWLKYNTQWLVRDVPETGRGLSAGLPDYPWWFGCDNEYALQGVLCAGQTGTVKSTIELLYHLSQEHNGNGRVIHEVSTNGVVYNPGNLNETPQFIMLLWDYFRWSGDLDLLKKYYPFVQKGLQWLLTFDKNGNLCPEGSGMMEIEGLNSEMIDVASYTCRAFDAASQIAEILNDTVNSTRYSRDSEKLKNLINHEWWVERQKSFADFRSDRNKAVSIISSAIRRAASLDKPWAVEELNTLKKHVMNEKDQGVRGYVVYHNWVVNTPMETGIADSAKAAKALGTADTFTDPFGMYVTGIDRDENLRNANIDSMRKKVFSYTGAVMTLPTGVQAVAACRYRENDLALAYIQKLYNSFSYALPGSMYEVSPDFGMMTQAWNIYGVEVPLIEYFLGVKPDAYHERILVDPDLPSSWKFMKIKHLPIGDNYIDIDIEKTEAGTIYKFSQKQKDWHIILKMRLENGMTLNLNNREQSITGRNNIITMDMTGPENRVWVY